MAGGGGGGAGEGGSYLSKIVASLSSFSHAPLLPFPSWVRWRVFYGKTGKFNFAYFHVQLRDVDCADKLLPMEGCYSFAPCITCYPAFCDYAKLC